MKLKNLKHIVKQEYGIYKSGKNNLSAELSELQQTALKNIRTNGYHVIESYCSREYCSQAISEINAIIHEREEEIWKDEHESDFRIYGADRISKPIAEFLNDPFLSEIGCTYINSNNKKGFTLGARLEEKENNLGSGGGWHRDTAHQKQIKAILYLSDVSEDNGPFQYITGSHRSKELIKGVIQSKFNPGETRFSDDRIKSIIGSDSDAIRSFTGKAGTLILTDTRGLHRGKPINSGVRYALTNYLWFDQEIPEDIKSILVK